MEYNYSNLTGVALLRADSHSQEIKINNGSDRKDLISETQFWGDDQNEGLYYDYESPTNNLGYAVSCEGWNDYTEKSTEKMSATATTAWVNDKILTSSNQSLCVIQGYAGCGKTTFVNSILRKIEKENIYLKYYNFYIGYVKNASENTFISSSIFSKLVEQIIKELCKDDGMNIYDEFTALFASDLSELSPILNKIFTPMFSKDALLYTYAQKIYDNKNAHNIEKFEKDFRVQISRAYDAKCNNTLRKFGNKVENEDMLDILLFIDYLWRCSVYLVRNSTDDINQIVVYDNLDIIDNHYLVAKFIDTLRSVLGNYTKYKNSSEQHLPVFKVILTVRKITYASVSRFAEVGSNEMNQHVLDVEFLDISNLYVPYNIIKHKANILLENIDTYLPEDAECRESVEYFLTEILSIPNEMFTDIRFADLLNHNVRACINMMDQVINSTSYKKYLNCGPHANASYRTSIWIHIICTILKTKKVWENLGYNLSSFNKRSSPTTLSRMILTYLSNRRTGCMKNIQGFTSSDISFKEIVETFEKIPFGEFDAQDSWEEKVAPSLEANHSLKDSRQTIVLNIAKMLQRNNSTEEIELWRRPLYYTHNAFPILDINIIQQTLLDQIQNFSNADKKITSFCITDEGYTFVEKIATHFEFYSVRYNNYTTKPICCIEDENELNELIERVYTEVKRCSIKQIWLMNFYMNKYHISKNNYIKLWFHPRTDNFEPQLHVVRTIYDHINYLNNYRNYLYELYGKNDEKFQPLNYCLVGWIGKYLDLYREYFFSQLNDTDGNYNNNVWLDLMYLYWLVSKDDKKIGKNFLPSKNSIIVISRASNISRSKQDEYSPAFRISDDKLLELPIIFPK